MKFELPFKQKVIALTIFIMGSILSSVVVACYVNHSLDEVVTAAARGSLVFIVSELIYGQYLFKNETTGGKVGVFVLGAPMLIFPIVAFSEQPLRLIYVSLAAAVFGIFCYAFLLYARFQNRKLMSFKN